MKNKKVLIILLLIMITLTGCTKQLKDEKNNVVKNEETGQVLPSNILCKPSDDIYNIYKENNISKKEYLKKEYKKGNISKKDYNSDIKDIDNYSKYLKDLPICSKFSVTSGKYEGIWTSIFVKPLAWVIIQIGNIFKNYGIAVIITTLLIRLILCPVTIKTAKQSENMKKAQPELQKLEKKYQNKQDQQSLTMKSQEMMAIYKKYNISPLSGCLFAFLQIPLFFAFYEALYRLPAIFEDKLLGFELSTTPWIGISNGKYLYLILPVLVLLVTYFSFKQNQNTGAGVQEKQMKMMLNVMTFVIFFTSFSMSTAIVLYWITNSGFTIIQNLIVKRSIKK